MKLLLDESLPRALKHLFSGHDVQTVPECGWAGLSNGELLRLAETRFGTFITADQNLQYQQNLAGLDIRCAGSVFNEYESVGFRDADSAGSTGT